MQPPRLLGGGAFGRFVLSQNRVAGRRMSDRIFEDYYIIPQKILRFTSISVAPNVTIFRTTRPAPCICPKNRDLDFAQKCIIFA